MIKNFVNSPKKPVGGRELFRSHLQTLMLMQLDLLTCMDYLFADSRLVTRFQAFEDLAGGRFL